jgi:hypothetical protein
MRTSSALLLVAALGLLTRCAPATATAAFAGSKEDAVTCAATTLQSLGYFVLDADVENGIRAERDLHARNPFSGGGDADRITIAFSNKEPRFLVVGESVHAPGVRRFSGSPARNQVSNEGMPGRVRTSGAVRSDVAAISRACGS